MSPLGTIDLVGRNYKREVLLYMISSHACYNNNCNSLCQFSSYTIRMNCYCNCLLPRAHDV